VVATTQDIVADAIRSAEFSREAAKRNQGIRLYRRKPRLLDGPEGLV
jgi:hypothetical protein